MYSKYKNEILYHFEKNKEDSFKSIVVSESMREILKLAHETLCEGYSYRGVSSSHYVLEETQNGRVVLFRKQLRILK